MRLRLLLSGLVLVTTIRADLLLPSGRMYTRAELAQGINSVSRPRALGAPLKLDITAITDGVKNQLAHIAHQVNRLRRNPFKENEEREDTDTDTLDGDKFRSGFIPEENPHSNVDTESSRAPSKDTGKVHFASDEDEDTVILFKGDKGEYCERYEQHFSFYCVGDVDQTKQAQQVLQHFCPSYKKACPSKAKGSAVPLTTWPANPFTKEITINKAPSSGEHVRGRPAPAPASDEDGAEEEPAPLSKYDRHMLYLKRRVPCKPDCDSKIYPHCTTECKCDYIYPIVQRFCNPPPIPLFLNTCRMWYNGCPKYEQYHYNSQFVYSKAEKGKVVTPKANNVNPYGIPSPMRRMALGARTHRVEAEPSHMVVPPEYSPDDTRAFSLLAKYSRDTDHDDLTRDDLPKVHSLMPTLEPATRTHSQAIRSLQGKQEVDEDFEMIRKRHQRIRHFATGNDHSRTQRRQSSPFSRVAATRNQKSRVEREDENKNSRSNARRVSFAKPNVDERSLNPDVSIEVMPKTDENEKTLTSTKDDVVDWSTIPEAERSKEHSSKTSRTNQSKDKKKNSASTTVYENEVSKKAKADLTAFRRILKDEYDRKRINQVDDALVIPPEPKEYQAKGHNNYGTESERLVAAPDPVKIVGRAKAGQVPIVPSDAAWGAGGGSDAFKAFDGFTDSQGIMHRPRSRSPWSKPGLWEPNPDNPHNRDHANKFWYRPDSVTVDWLNGQMNWGAHWAVPAIGTGGSDGFSALHFPSIGNFVDIPDDYD